MSLILEALKKVERERATPEQRGFLVIGPAAWAPSRSNVAWVLGMVAAAAVAGIAVYALTRPPAASSGPVAVSEERNVPAAAPPLEAVRGGGLAGSVPGPPAASGPQRARSAAAPLAAATAPPVPAANDPILVLHAISVQDGTPIAVVNERVVREGDRFDGVRILRIGAAEVEVEVNGARRTLRF